MKIHYAEIQPLRVISDERKHEQLRKKINQLFKPTEYSQRNMTAAEAIEKGGTIEPDSWWLKILSFLASEPFRQIIMLILAMVTGGVRTSEGNSKSDA